MSQSESTERSDENEQQIRHAETVEIRSRNDRASGGVSHLVNISTAMHNTGLSNDELKNCVDLYEDGMELLPAPLFVGDIGDVRGRETWKNVTPTSERNDGTPTGFQMTIPDSAIEALGYEKNSCTGELIDVYVGDQLLAFQRPLQGEFTVDVPAGVEVGN